MKTTHSKIAYIEKGQGDTLLFIHGFCGSSKYWGKGIPKLSET